MILHKFVKEFLNDSSVESKSAANFYRSHHVFEMEKQFVKKIDVLRKVKKLHRI